MQLPLLIKEKIDYYRYILPHKEKVKQLNQEYNENVILKHNYYYDFIYWIKTGKVIIIVNDNDNKYTYNKQHCVNFRKSKYEYCQLIQNYYYSSGLNNPNGFKYIFESLHYHIMMIRRHILI